MSEVDTIVALASGAGQAGVAVIRLSGPAAGPCLEGLSRAVRPAPRQASLRTLHDAEGEAIDRALVLFFAAPHSFTGDDVVELHVHGGRAVIDGVLEAVLATPGVRPAEAGAFSKRAFLNGKMDLTAAEGLADLVAAETAAQRRQALHQLGGALGRLYDDWAHRLTHALALLEADIDFGEEEDLPPDLAAQVDDGLRAVAGEIGRHLGDAGRGEKLRDGLTVVLLGAPNAGKSSLLNALTGREVAIVTATAGTTRDVVAARLDIAGVPVEIADTAGLHEAPEVIEAEGIRRARLAADRADLKMLVYDPTQAAASEAALAPWRTGSVLVVASKADLAAAPGLWHGHAVLAVDSPTGQGLPALQDALAEAVRAQAGAAGGGEAVLTRARHRQALERAHAALERYRSAPQRDLAAEDVRLAARAIGEITGRVDVEGLLDIIFRDFCIGK